MAYQYQDVPRDTSKITTAEETVGLLYNELVPILPVLRPKMISSNKTSDDFMIKHPDRIDWRIAVLHLKLSPEVIRVAVKQESWDWKLACKMQQLPADTMDEYGHLMDWEDVQKYQVLTPNVIKGMHDIIDFRVILQVPGYPSETLEFIIMFLKKKYPNALQEVVRLMTTHQKLDDAFLENFLDMVPLDILVERQTLSDKFIRANFKRLSMDRLVRFQKLSVEFMEEHFGEMDPMAILTYQRNLPMTFIRKHSAVFPAGAIFRYQNPDLAYFHENNASVDWNVLQQRTCSSTHYKLHPLAVEPEVSNMILEKVDWNQVSTIMLSDDFVVNNQKKLNMLRVLTHSPLKQETLDALGLNPIEMVFALKYQTLPSANWKKQHENDTFWWNWTPAEEYIRSMPHDAMELFDDYAKNIKWSAALKQHKFPEWVLERYSKNMDWYSVSRYQTLSSAFIQRNLVKLDLTYIAQYQKLDDSFIMFNREILQWNLISRHQVITTQMAHQCASLLDTEEMEKNKTMTYSEIEALIQIISTHGKESQSKA